MSLGAIFLFAFSGVMPIVLLILLGYFLRRINLLDDNFLRVANKFVFNAALPVLLFFNVYNIGSFGEIEWNSVIFSAVVILLLFVAGLAYSVIFVKDKKQKGVVWQSFFRSNFAIIGLPLSEALGGDEGIAIASILSTFSIPMFNAFAAVSLSVFVSDEDKNRISAKDIVLRVIKNPLIIGVFAGFVVLWIRNLIPENAFSIRQDLPFIYDAVEMFSRIASPLALVVLGGQFRFDAVKSLKKQIIPAVIARIVFAPALGIVLAILISDYFHFTSAHYAAFIALFGSPVAVSSAIMAQQMDNDGQLANQILVWTSIFSVLTVFITVAVLKYIAII